MVCVVIHFMSCSMGTHCVCWKFVFFQQDNAKSHVCAARKTHNKIEELDNAEVLLHLAYSPDIAPSDYGLVQSVQHLIKGCPFEWFDEIEEVSQEFFKFKAEGLVLWPNSKAYRSLAEGCGKWSLFWRTVVRFE